MWCVKEERRSWRKGCNAERTGVDYTKYTHGEKEI